jgi:PAS domain S-box-containing protein
LSRAAKARWKGWDAVKPRADRAGSWLRTMGASSQLLPKAKPLPPMRRAPPSAVKPPVASNGRGFSGRFFSYVFEKGDRLTSPAGVGQYAIKAALVSATYFGAAKLGLTLAYANSSITAVWAPTGISLAALLLWGIRLWPAVALGAFFANWGTGVPLLTVLGITTGNTLEALAGAYLLMRFARFRCSLERVRDVLALAVLGGVISTMLSATVGVASLRVGGDLSASDMVSAWRVWWLGDMGGDLLVAPFLLTLASAWRSSFRFERALEAVGLLGVLVAVSLLTFSRDAPLSFLVFPGLVWAALRFRQPGAATASLIVASIAVWFTADGLGPFVRDTLDDSLLVSQTFMGVASVTALFLAAVTAERMLATDAVQRAHDELELKVRDRTADLERSNLELGLRSAIAANMAEGVALIRVSDETIVYANPRFEQMFGYGPAELDGKSVSHINAPTDRTPEETAAEIISELHEQGIWSGEVLNLKKDGTPFWTQANVSTFTHPEHGPVWVSVKTDITERKRAEDKITLARELAFAIAEAETVEEALQLALRKICEATGSALGQAWTVNAPSRQLECSDAWYASCDGLGPFRQISLERTFELGVGLPGRVWSAKEAAWIKDVRRDPNFSRPFTREVGLGAGLAVPVLAQDTVVAVMEFFLLEPRERDEGLVDLVSAVAAQVGSLIRRKQSEAIRRASEERFRAVAASANDAIVSADGSGNIVYFNPSAERVFGYSASESLGKPLTTLMPERFHDPHAEALKRFLATGEARVIGKTVELAGRRKDGSEFPLELSLSTWKQGQDPFFTAILRDISEHVQAQRKLAESAAELERRTRELERSNADLAEFASVISHDLHEPLRMVSTYVELLAGEYEDQLDEEAREFIQFASDGANRMRALIKDLLACSRVGSSEDAPTSVDCSVAVQHASDALSGFIAEAKATVNVGDLPTVTANFTQISELFQNLVSNAIKFTAEGRRPRVEISAERDGAAWRFSVADDGIGIEPRYRDRVFGMFERLHGRSAYDGTGAGLAICKKIVERHGGRIWVTSTPGKGSTFQFTIPDPEGGIA